MIEEYDSSNNAWEYYKKVYNETHWSLIKEFDTENLYCTKNKNIIRYHAHIKSDSKYVEKLGAKFSLSGDCAFNFNSKKISKFVALIENNVDCKQSIEIKKKLQQCKDFHHSLNNLTLLPTTGSLNNFKGTYRFQKNDTASLYINYSSQAYDRLDTFLACLEDYYNKKSCLVLSRSSEINRPYLINFLKSFEDIYEYCNIMCFIKDKAFVDELKNNGRKPIINIEDLDRYMRLALNYWQNKKDCDNT